MGLCLWGGGGLTKQVVRVKEAGCASRSVKQ